MFNRFLSWMGDLLPESRIIRDDGTVILSIEDIHRHRLAYIAGFGIFAVVLYTCLQIYNLGLSGTGYFNLATGFVGTAICLYGLWMALYSERIEAFIRILLLSFSALIWAEVLMSGGITGYHAAVFPILPSVGALLLSSRDTLLYIGLNVIVALAIAALGLGTNLVPVLDLSPSTLLLMTTVTIGVSVITCGGVAFVMAHQNEKIDGQLRDLVYHQSHLAAHDHLSGLGNRVRLQQRFEEIDPEEVFDILLIDLDGFKAINDTYGHDAGDYLLKTFADRLREVTDDNDLLVRLGGDEFVIILESVDGQLGAVRKYGEYLIDIISRPYPWKNEVLRVSASIGHARFPHHGRNGSKVLSLADKALYVAKNAGKAQCVTYGVRPVPKLKRGNKGLVKQTA